MVDHTLSWMIFIPLVGAAVILCLPSRAHAATKPESSSTAYSVFSIGVSRLLFGLQRLGKAQDPVGAFAQPFHRRRVRNADVLVSAKGFTGDDRAANYFCWFALKAPDKLAAWEAASAMAPSSFSAAPPTC
mgnify:CR=1 FL=1